MSYQYDKYEECKQMKRDLRAQVKVLKSELKQLTAMHAERAILELDKFAEHDANCPATYGRKCSVTRCGLQKLRQKIQVMFHYEQGRI